MNNIDIASIISNTKKDFTRDRKSAIKDFLVKNNNNSVIISHMNKARGASIKIYTIQGDAIKTYDYVIKNARIVLQALDKNGVELYHYNKSTGDITPYNIK